MIKVELERVHGDYGFKGTDAAGHEVLFDSSTEHGGSNFGVRPMQSLLFALGSCSGIDIVSILKKQKQAFSSFKMKIEGEREDAKPIALWKTIHIVFEFSGEVDEEKAKKACALSIEKYCSVAETLRRAGAQITWSTQINP
ncbi:MAG TPA: OsmC family protein [Flavisolibacter sp.]|nr:OsmC family protein [Flavisolibacter sp.]